MSFVSPSEQLRVCHQHLLIPAVAICTECHKDICGACHGMDLRGFAVCQRCRLKYGPIGTPWEADSTRWTIRGFLATLVEVVSAPRSYFMRLHPSVASWMPAAVFGIICIGLGTFFQTLWQSLFMDGFAEALQAFSEQYEIDLAQAKLAVFAAIPMMATLIFSLHIILLYSALKLVGAARVTLPLVMRIVGYSSAAYLFLVIPPWGAFSIGHFLMVVWLFNLEVSAVRWFFSLGFWQSIIAVMIPFMFILMTGGIGG